MFRGSQLRVCRLLFGLPFARCSTPASSLLLKPTSTLPSSFPQPSAPTPPALRRFYSVDTVSVDPRGPVYGLSEIFEEFLSYLTVPPAKRSSLLKKLRKRQHRERVSPRNARGAKMVGGFDELDLREEVLEAAMELGVSAHTEIKLAGIPAVLDGRSVAPTSPDGSGKTLAYMLPIVEVVRKLAEGEYHGIAQLSASSLVHNKIASARHNFLKIFCSENKWAALVQVLSEVCQRGKERPKPHKNLCQGTC